MHKQRKARRHETSNHLRKRCLQTLEAGNAQKPTKKPSTQPFPTKTQYQPKTGGSPEKHNKARHRLQVSARPWLPGCGRGLKAVAGKARRRVQQPPRQHPDLRKWPGVHPGRTEMFAPAISSPPFVFVIGEIRHDAPRPSIQVGKSATRNSKLRDLGWI